MSSNKTNLAVLHNSEFDPTRREDGPGTDAESTQPDPLTIAYARIPAESQMAAVAREMFGAELPESVIRAIIQESEEVAHSTRKILQEHMRMGGNFLHIRTSIVNTMVAQGGDKKGVRDRAASQAYLFIERLFRHSASKVRLYIRCYEKFISNSAAVEILTQTDMQLLIANDTPDELIDLVIEARKENPDLTKNQVKQLIKGFEQAREQLVEKDTRLEVVTTELSNTVGQLDETQLELKRVIEERDAVKQDAARARESAERTLVEMSSVSQSMSTLNMELANRERDIKDLHRKLAEAQAAVRTETKEVPTIPGEFETMEAAIEDQITRSREAGRKMEEVQQQLAALEGQLAEQRAAAEAGEVLEKKVSTLIDRFGQYAQEYHTAQLLVTADGSPQRFTKLFQALADLIGKHHSEVLAAAHAS